MPKKANDPTLELSIDHISRSTIGTFHVALQQPIFPCPSAADAACPVLGRCNIVTERSKARPVSVLEPDDCPYTKCESLLSARLGCLPMQQQCLQPLPLADLAPGMSGRIVAVLGGRELSRKLLGLGLRVGSEVRVEHRRGRGLVVSAGETRIALGGSIVEKLLVEPRPSPPVDHPSG